MKPSAATGDLFTSLCFKNINSHCVKEYKFNPGRRWRFDYAIPEYRIAVEVEGGVWTGGRHVRPKGFLNDMEKYNAAAVDGWRVLRVTPQTLCTKATFDMLKAAILHE